VIPILASPAPLFTEPVTVIAVLASVLAGVFALSSVEKLEPLFKFAPPVIWAYFIPMMLTTFGVTPSSSPVYEWMSTYLLPFSLFLLMITVDIRAILRLGPRALFMLLIGTMGIVIGAPIAFFLFGGFFSDPVAWKGFAALSGSWIGGTANMIFVKESVSTPDSTLAPLLVVDVVAGYGWMGILIFLSAYQQQFDRWVGASRGVIDKLQQQLEEMATDRVPITLGTFVIILGLGLGATLAAEALGARLPELGEPTVISAGTWTILIVVTVGLLLSFTPARELEKDGASRIGYAALYLLLTSIGASADLVAVLDAPLYLVAGIVWLAVHVTLLFGAAIVSKSPLFFVATGSMANVGGAASAPIVAGVYVPSLAPVGLLMGVAGYILGVYVALFCAEVLRYVHMFLM